jgi:hypothetical protein
MLHRPVAVVALAMSGLWLAFCCLALILGALVMSSSD